MPVSPLVSVIMPNFNKGNYIKDAIESILRQTYRNLEIIIVDGGSTDESSSIIEKYASEHDNLVYLIDKRRGPSAARNLGIEKAHGELIAFLDSDDLYRRDKLSKQVQLFGDNRALICYHDSSVIDESGTPTGELLGKSHMRPPETGREGIIFRHLLKYDYVSFGTVMIPKNLLKLERFDIRYRLGEDWDLLVRLARRFPFRFIDEPLSAYRIYTGNSWREVNRVATIKIFLALRKKWLKVLNPNFADTRYLIKTILSLELRLVAHNFRVAKHLERLIDTMHLNHFNKLFSPDMP